MVFFDEQLLRALNPFHETSQSCCQTPQLFSPKRTSQNTSSWNHDPSLHRRQWHWTCHRNHLSSTVVQILGPIFTVAAERSHETTWFEFIDQMVQREWARHSKQIDKDCPCVCNLESISGVAHFCETIQSSHVRPFMGQTNLIIDEGTITFHHQLNAFHFVHAGLHPVQQKDCLHHHKVDGLAQNCGHYFAKQFSVTPTPSGPVPSPIHNPF